MFAIGIEALQRVHSGNPAFRRPSISSFEFFDGAPRAIPEDKGGVGLKDTSSRLTRLGVASEKRMEAEHIRLEGRPFSGPWRYPYNTLPAHGLSPAQLAEYRQQLAESLKDFREALALGDISAVQDHIAEAEDVFQINMDRQSPSFHKLGIEVLRAYARPAGHRAAERG